MQLDMAFRLDELGVIAVVRLTDLTHAVTVTEALIAGGVRAVEFTFTNRDAAKAISAASKAVGSDGYIGAGSVLDAETARAAILAGAEYIVTPTTNVDAIKMGNRYGVKTLVGALTPTEMLTAVEAGAAYVKVFPASLGGPRYLKDVLGPLPQLRLIPTGGVSLENASDFIAAGAVAVAMGSNLVDEATVAAQEWEVITGRAKAIVEAVAAAKARPRG